MTKAKGRKPINQPVVWAAIQSRPADGLDYGAIVEISGLLPASVKDALWKMRSAGTVPWLKRGGVLLHFGSDALRDAYDVANPAGAKRMRRRGNSGNGRPPRAPRILDAITRDGSTSVEIAKRTRIGEAHVRRVLGDLLRSGKAWRYGTQKRFIWFKSQEDLEAARAAIDAAELMRNATFELKSARGQKRQAAKMLGHGERAKSKRSIVDGLSRGTPKAAAERREVEIIGMETAKRTEAVKYPDHRFTVTGHVIGGWATMGVGKYLEDAA